MSADTSQAQVAEDPGEGRGYDARLIRRLWPFVRPHARPLWLSLGTLFLVSASKLLQPLVMGDVATQAEHKNLGLLMRDGGVLIGLLMLTQLLVFLQTYAMQISGARAMADLRAAIFRLYQRLQLRYFDRVPVGALVARASNDVDSVGELFASGVLNAVGDLVHLVGIVVTMVLLDWRLSLIAFAALPVVAALVSVVRRLSRATYREIRVQIAQFNVFLNEQVNGISVVQALAREAAMAREMEAISARYRDVNIRQSYYEAVLDATIQMVGTFCLASALCWAGFNRVGAHAVSFALLVAFSRYIQQFFEPIGKLSDRYTVFQSAMAGAERVFALLDEDDVDPPVLPAERCGPPGPADEALALEQVDFEYKPHQPVLREVSLHARRGERIALVGATGAGKSTVASLLLRHYAPLRGCVRVMGRDVRSYAPAELRRLFSVVPQDVFLFTGTVLSNIAMTDELPDRQRAEEALARIGAREVFLSREGGLDAPVDERGSNFSAGERQLLAFARAVYRNAPLLILDEATASVDPDTEARLQLALDAAMEGRTALVIAHRLATIRSADRILVFHQGRLVESGPHQELLALGGLYAKLYRLQFAERPGEAKAKARVG